MGESALKSHAKGKKHIELLKASEPAVSMSCFLASAKTSSAVAASTDSSVSSREKLNLTEQTGGVPVVKMTDFCTKTETLKAEILWTLKIVNAHNSFRSCEDSVFSSVFPDSAISRNFKCGETKSRYLATFGIAPYFSEALKKRVKDEDTYVLLFDESLNKELKLKQLDTHVCYWNTVESEICTEYLTVVLGSTPSDHQSCEKSRWSEECAHHSWADYVSILCKKKYFQHLEDQRKEQEQAEVNRKRKAQEEKLSDLKEKKRRIERDIDHLIVEADRLAEQAEMKGAVRLLTQSNALRSKSKEKRLNFPELLKN